MPFNCTAFGEDFQWGVSTAAYQIEGGHDADGKGFSIWDEFSRKKRKIRGGHHGNITCDFYNRYDQDIRLLSELNIPNYRFSISWSRIFPLGTGAVNQKGVDFYNLIIDTLISRGIEPWITLYHWDLPAALEHKGGWTNREILYWFSDYAAFCVKQFGDRVKNWMILNEPMVFTGAGYFLGIHAPGRKGLDHFLAAVHHAALCQAEGGRIIKSLQSQSKVGTTFSYSPVGPWRENKRDRTAALKTDTLLNRVFIEPLLGMGYPVKDLKILQGLEKYYKDGDSRRLVFDIDFAGLQNYTREIVRHSFIMPFIHAKAVKASKRNVEYTEMDWEVYPPSIFEAIMRLNQYKNLKEIIVTENGAAFKDDRAQGVIHDPRRLGYLKDHIAQVLLARQAGARVNGYFVWTLLDNFEWAEGYTPKFGLVHVNFETQERIIKSSGKWYADFLWREDSADIF
jgi:beta-glucosidase